MSHEIDEIYDAYGEARVRARKVHECDACGDPIRRGDLYTKVGIVWGRSAETVKRCLRCQAIHKHLRALDPGNLWPDERLNCGEDYRDHWGDDPPPEIARLAFMTPDEMQRELAQGKSDG